MTSLLPYGSRRLKEDALLHTRDIGSLKVSAIGLGGMPLSIQGRPDEAQGVAVIHAALDAGVTFIDTADVYCLDDDDIGHNERLIARALAGRAAVVATKGGLERPDGSWVVNGKPDHLKRACDRSLAALGVQTIDLYQLHAPDPDVPYEDSIGALADLQRAGKIRHIGLSNVDVPQIEAARRQVEVVSVQNRCNPFDRASFANGVVAYCHREGIAFLPHSPVGGHRGHARTPTDPTLGRVAARHGVTPYQVCLAWFLKLSPVIIPIPGASRAASIRSSAAAADVVLTDADMAEMEQAFPTGMA